MIDQIIEDVQQNTFMRPNHLLCMGAMVERKRTSKKWTALEEETLRRLYPLRIKKEISKGELMMEIPNRTWYGIQSHAIHRLGLGKRLAKGVLRKCNRCGREAKNSNDLEQFTKDLRYKHGHRNLCNACANDYTSKIRTQKPFHYLCMTKKSECKRRYIPFSLTASFLEELWNKQGGACALSGLKMLLPYGKRDFDWVGSIDRINPKQGYMKENVRWILNCVNTFKGQKDDAFVYKISKAITELRENACNR